jgi:hypothetical protein
MEVAIFVVVKVERGESGDSSVTSAFPSCFNQRIKGKQLLPIKK